MHTFGDTDTRIVNFKTENKFIPVHLLKKNLQADPPPGCEFNCI